LTHDWNVIVTGFFGSGTAPEPLPALLFAEELPPPQLATARSPRTGPTANRALRNFGLFTDQLLA
jgi:hypothetical protein